MNAQNDTIYNFSSTDSLVLETLDSMYSDSSQVIDTIFYDSFVPYDLLIFRNSKINLRKSLTASLNPPVRRNLNNYFVLLWALFIAFLIIFFKRNYVLQYRLINKAWITSISFNEFFTTQTAVFKNSKLLTWLIISQSLSLGVFIIIKTSYKQHFFENDLILAVVISITTIGLFIGNQWLKNVFAYSFYQPSLSEDYAVIFRIHAYILSLFLLPILLILYYNGSSDTRIVVIVGILIYLIVVYASSLVKFTFSGRFLQNDSNFILILYLCAFEILPLLVLIKSINNLLVI
jgi:hypothetical protein